MDSRKHADKKDERKAPEKKERETKVRPEELKTPSGFFGSISHFFKMLSPVQSEAKPHSRTILKPIQIAMPPLPSLTLPSPLAPLRADMRAIERRTRIDQSDLMTNMPVIMNQQIIQRVTLPNITEPMLANALVNHAVIAEENLITNPPFDNAQPAIDQDNVVVEPVNFQPNALLQDHAEQPMENAQINELNAVVPRRLGF